MRRRRRREGKGRSRFSRELILSADLAVTEAGGNVSNPPELCGSAKTAKRWRRRDETARKKKQSRYHKTSEAKDYGETKKKKINKYISARSISGRTTGGRGRAGPKRRVAVIFL